MPTHESASSTATAGRPAATTLRRRSDRTGLAQLTLVEHALCQLDTRQSLKPLGQFHTGFYYSDAAGERKFANVVVGSTFGFSPDTEYYLWGLLALTFNQPTPSRVFSATPYFILRKLGISLGGKNYAEFKAALDRIAGLSYRCDALYDPIRGQRRRAAFQFLSYSLPLSDDSQRAWQFTWNDQFFDLCAATGGKLFFDLTSDTYRSLDSASRRLFLFLHKVFWRRKDSPRFDLRHLAVNVLGFSADRPTSKLKFDVTRCIERLLAGGLIALPLGVMTVAQLFEKHGPGHYRLRFHRGPYFETTTTAKVANALPTLANSPLYDPLRSLGFEDRQIRWMLKTYSASRIEIWTDITLAKLEHDGPKAFSVAPQAYLLDNLKHERTKPDWYLDLKKREAQRHKQAAVEKLLAGINQADAEAAYRAARQQAWQEFRRDRGVTRDEFHRVSQTFLEIHRRQMREPQAVELAAQDAERHFATGFEFPEFSDWVTSAYLHVAGEA